MNDDDGLFQVFEPDIERESHSTGTSYLYSIFMPVGINLRFSKKHTFFSRLNYFVELRWVYNRVVLDGLDETLSQSPNPSGLQLKGGFGFKYNL